MSVEEGNKVINVLLRIVPSINTWSYHWNWEISLDYSFYLKCSLGNSDTKIDKILRDEKLSGKYFFLFYIILQLVSFFFIFSLYVVHVSVPYRIIASACLYFSLLSDIWHALYHFCLSLLLHVCTECIIKTKSWNC